MSGFVTGCPRVIGELSIVRYARAVNLFKRMSYGFGEYPVAQHVLVQLVDDLDGTASDDVATVQFGLDGVTYEIDLTAVNADRLRDELAEYVASGRRTGGRIKRGARTGGKGSPANHDAGQIREWAQANGVELAARGRIPSHVVDSYREAQNSSTNGAASKKRSRGRKS